MSPKRQSPLFEAYELLWLSPRSRICGMLDCQFIIDPALAQRDQAQARQ
jgi:hypothetical protein